MKKNYKILIAGVGGQGIVFLSNIMVEAAVLSNLPVSVSEIHGLSQRGGVVTSSIGLGEYCTGFIGLASVDFLIGLEPLETQRCIPYLHKQSGVIFGNYRVQPYAVNAETAQYPEVNLFVNYLKQQGVDIVYIEDFPPTIDYVLYNIFLLGRATRMNDFPIKADKIIEAINNTVRGPNNKKSLAAFSMGIDFETVPKLA
ncbi:MAG: 2-oxoacid:acceptor oxidoreductase family protein [Bacteroidetes bacterium]|nr:2-oxoacid:acceptor oxidoreductase family protein [Bacteroidota bacterium]